MFTRTVHVRDVVAFMRERVERDRTRGNDRLTRRHRLPMPAWLEQAGPAEYPVYRSSYKAADRLALKGHLCWAHIVQANEAMLEPGKEDLPCSVVFWSFDGPEADGEVEGLSAAAAALFRLKSVPHAFSDGRLNTLGESLRDESTPFLYAEVPEPITETPEPAAVHCSMMLRRRLWPKGRRHLSLSWFPVFIDPRREVSPLPLCHHYWHRTFYRLWKQ